MLLRSSADFVSIACQMPWAVAGIAVFSIAVAVCVEHPLAQIALAAYRVGVVNESSRSVHEVLHQSRRPTDLPWRGSHTAGQDRLRPWPSTADACIALTYRDLEYCFE